MEKEGGDLPITFCDSADEITWTRCRYLGKGERSYVYTVTPSLSSDNNSEYSSTSKQFAGKIVSVKNLTLSRKRYLQEEIRIHSSIEPHSGIVEWVTHIWGREWVLLVTELYPKGTLFDLLKVRKSFREEEIRHYIGDIIPALMHIHQQGVVHCDMKLGNMLLTADNHVKICDFGFAAALPKVGSGLTRVCGSPNYLSPEILACWDFQNSAECMDITEQDKEEVGYDHRVDIWSLGVVIYTLAYGKPPFETGSVEMTYQRIRDVTFYFPDTSRRSPSEGGEVFDAIKDMIRRILKKNPDDRPLLQELFEHLIFG